MRKKRLELLPNGSYVLISDGNGASLHVNGGETVTELNDEEAKEVGKVLSDRAKVENIIGAKLNGRKNKRRRKD